MSVFINQLDILSEIETSHWLIIDTPGKTKRVSIESLQDFLGGVKSVNSVEPDEDGNVNLTPDDISDVSSDRKFVTAGLLDLISILVDNGDGSLFLSNDGTYKAAPGSGGGGGSWGSITGNIENQEDLQEALSNLLETINSALAGKEDALGFTPEDAANKGQANGYPSLDGSGKVPTSQLPPIASGVRVIFRFNSDLFTEDERLFRGLIGTLTGTSSALISAVAFETRVDTTSTWTACADLTALQNWINSNVTGNKDSGTKFWIRVLATYGTTSGVAEYILNYV